MANDMLAALYEDGAAAQKTSGKPVASKLIAALGVAATALQGAALAHTVSSHAVSAAPTDSQILAMGGIKQRTVDSVISPHKGKTLDQLIRDAKHRGYSVEVIG
jgi:hypothetical protein